MNLQKNYNERIKQLENKFKSLFEETIGVDNEIIELSRQISINSNILYYHNIKSTLKILTLLITISIVITTLSIISAPSLALIPAFISGQLTTKIKDNLKSFHKTKELIKSYGINPKTTNKKESKEQLEKDQEREQYLAQIFSEKVVEFRKISTEKNNLLENAHYFNNTTTTNKKENNVVDVVDIWDQFFEERIEYPEIHFENKIESPSYVKKLGSI